MARPLVAALALLAVGVAIAAGPSTFVPVCDHGMKLASGAMAPMKCHWTAQVSLVPGGLLALAGLLLLALREQAARLGVAVMAIACALAEILVAGPLVGVCGGETMYCHMVTRPVLFALAALAALVALCVAVRGASSLRRGPTRPAAGRGARP